MFKPLVALIFASAFYGSALCLEAIRVESTNPDDIDFFLYPNAADTNDYDELIYNDLPSVTGSRYNPANPVILLSHGFRQNFTTQFPVYVRDAYLQAGYAETHNIIVVNWGKLSSAAGSIDVPIVGQITALPLYIDVLSNVPIVGKRVQEFVSFLQSNALLSSGENVRLVGQSLGSHVSGYAGQFYQAETGTKFARITGTDPALPGFEKATADKRLSSDDATFVDIVHTNQGVFGYLGDIGHVDFYVNGGGPTQPACFPTNATDLFCSHNLAPRYFAKSIPVSPTYTACPRRLLGFLTPLFCTSDNRIVFGEHVPTTARGAYDLNMTL